jgi:hypothetical protein
MTWQEKNIAVGLAALFVLIVMAHLTFGSGPATSGAGSVVTEPVVTAPTSAVESPAAAEPAHEPR